ncbi:hypothetical protein Bp8pS_246 [Bacillus phage vB_BpuM-BpSp]|nr:hypothetical protein Bp8pS_246 [Bacillus phage vB_BpuM-BpSp]
MIKVKENYTTEKFNDLESFKKFIELNKVDITLHEVDFYHFTMNGLEAYDIYIPDFLIYEKFNIPRSNYKINGLINSNYYLLYHEIKNIDEFSKTDNERNFTNFLENNSLYYYQILFINYSIKELIKKLIKDNIMYSKGWNEFQKYNEVLVSQLDSYIKKDIIEHKHKDILYRVRFSNHLKFDRLLARGIPYTQISEILKVIYLEENHFIFKEGKTFAIRVSHDRPERKTEMFNPIIILTVVGNKDNKEISFIIKTILDKKDDREIYLNEVDDALFSYLDHKRDKFKTIKYKSNPDVFNRLFPNIVF